MQKQKQKQDTTGKYENQINNMNEQNFSSGCMRIFWTHFIQIFISLIRWMWCNIIVLENHFPGSVLFHLETCFTRAFKNLIYLTCHLNPIWNSPWNHYFITYNPTLGHHNTSIFLCFNQWKKFMRGATQFCNIRMEARHTSGKTTIVKNSFHIYS